MKNVWVAGNGGIGHALIEKLESSGHKVKILSRQNNCNLTKEKEVRSLIGDHEALPDFRINTCVILHDKNHLPEKI